MPSSVGSLPSGTTKRIFSRPPISLRASTSGGPPAGAAAMPRPGRATRRSARRASSAVLSRSFALSTCRLATSTDASCRVSRSAASAVRWKRFKAPISRPCRARSTDETVETSTASPKLIQVYGESGTASGMSGPV